VSGQFIEEPHIVVSTTNADVGFDYPHHRDGLFHNHLEFTPGLLEPTSRAKAPEPMILDIIFRSKTENFPITAEVWGKGLPYHSVTFNLRPGSQ
jgi:hypothetical protein